jgi:hypothetical protein
MPARRKNFPGRSRSASFWQSQSRSKPIHGMRWKRRPQARSAGAAIGKRPKTFGPSSQWLRPPIVRQRPALPVKGLHADDHTQREQRDDARCEKCVKPRLSVRPPLFAFQAASDDGEFAASSQWNRRLRNTGYNGLDTPTGWRSRLLGDFRRSGDQADDRIHHAWR